MSRAFPRVTAGWRASGWLTSSSHVRGSRRMLGIWAAGLVAAVVVAHHGHLYLAALFGVLAVLGGAVLYMRLDTELTLRRTSAPTPGTFAGTTPIRQDGAPAPAVEVSAMGGTR